MAAMCNRKAWFAVSVLFGVKVHSWCIGNSFQVTSKWNKRIPASQTQLASQSSADGSMIDEEVCTWSIYTSPLDCHPEWKEFVDSLELKKSSVSNKNQIKSPDPVFEQVKLEATEGLSEPEAGPQLYHGILSQPSLEEAVVTIIAHEIATELIPATSIKNLFLELLTPQDIVAIHMDLIAVASRSPSVANVMTAMLVNKGFHALVCYRVGHRLWKSGRTGLAYYLQSTVSRKYSADIHPASQVGPGLYLNTGGGVVIGETAVVGKDVSILQGVTLGGTGKENGDRHPKVGNGVILQAGATVLGNIKVGDGAVVTAKSIVTKPVPSLAIVSGVPAKVKSYRRLEKSVFDKDDLERHLGQKYLKEWISLSQNNETNGS